MAPPSANDSAKARKVKTVLANGRKAPAAPGIDFGAALLYCLGGLIGFLTSLFFLFPGITSRGEQMSLAEWLRQTTPDSLVAIIGFVTAGVALAGIIVARGHARQQAERIATLEEIIGTKTELISTITHQMRTPLTSVKYATKMFLSGDFGEITDEQRSILGSIYSSVENLTTLTQDFLDASKLDSGTLEIVCKRHLLAEIERGIVGTIDRLKPMAEDKKVALRDTVKLDGKRAMTGDLAKISQVVENMIENAIVYTPAGGKVHVRAGSDEHNFTVAVTDSGIGIPPGEQAKVFSKYFRASNARATTSTGSGIGLYLGRRYIEAQHGKIWFTSSPGKGSTFTFAIPLSPESEAEEFLTRVQPTAAGTVESHRIRI
ncbi:MAG: HAMP domain-containing sensor histidine kinase [Patescibacteria group bacterium]|nr:HAMP domain-containing sensor histidine kinase [Patescibacteria group bacterium]